MMDVQIAATGAKRASMHEPNPRDTVRRLVEEHPGESEDELFALFRAAIGDDEATRRVIDLYYFTNTVRALTRPPRPTAAADTAALAATYKARLLDMIVPGIGKSLAETTFAECAKVGGWFARLAAKGAPEARVGDVLTATEVAAVFAGANDAD